MTAQPDMIRTRLDTLIRERGEDYSAISRMLGRNPAYIQQFLKRGTPRRLSEDDRFALAAHFGVPEEHLGRRRAAGQTVSIRVIDLNQLR